MRSPLRRLAWALAAAVLGWLIAGSGARPVALRPQGVTVEDRKRFGLSQGLRKERRPPRTSAQRAFEAFNRAQGARWKMRFSPRTGAPEALTEGEAAPRPGGHRAAAEAFLRETRDLTAVQPTDLALERQNSGSGMGHILYRQTYKGLPVEFSRVKVHVDDQGRVIGFNSSYEPDLSIGLDPSLTASQAFQSVLSEIGPVAGAGGDLVIFPSEMSGRSHLAWRFTVRQGWRLWRYYVDAHTGQVLFRYDDHRYQACMTSGTVTAFIAEINPVLTPYAWKPMRNQRVHVKDGSHYADTNAQGFFCSDTKGKIFTALQGPYANVSNFRGPSAHYDNGLGAWATIGTPVSSPHPYPDGATVSQTVNLDAIAPTAVKVLPVFSQFNVGTWEILEGEGQIIDDDQLFILNGAGYPVASYVGNRGPFNGAAVAGRQYSLKLKANASGSSQHGYDVLVSSYLTLSNADDWNVNGSSLAWWPSSHTSLNLGGEFSAFYHVNAMHDWFVGGVNKSSYAFIGVPLNVNVYVGPDLLSPFYSPDQDNLNFSDINSASPDLAATDDATAARHEYVHYVQERIFSSPYFGQSGAVQEALSYYFAASALNHSTSGLWFNGQIGNPNPIMELNCPPNCKVLSAANWAGEVHDDSAYIAQAFWDIRKRVISELDLPAACADGLIFESLLFFPESFAEYYDALIRVDKAGAVAACIEANKVGAIITSAFEAHGLPYPKGDGWERNDGFMTAVDVSTMASVAATVYPAGDIDTYSFGAGPGRMRVKLSLPQSGNFYKAYAVTLYDRRHRKVGAAQPPLDGLNTVDGQYCETFDCTTTQAEANLDLVVSEPGLYYLQVHGAESLSYSNSGVNSATPYVLSLDYPKAAALESSIVSAVVDNDLISFDVKVASFSVSVTTLPYHFAYAQLRDHVLAVIPNTLAVPGSAASYLAWVSSQSALGSISGQVRLNGSFGARFPAVGTVHLEVFAYNVNGSTISLGFSQPMNLTSNQSKLTAFNNVFNPLKGGKTTVKYEVPTSGRITIKLYSLDGTLVATLFDDYTTGGKGALDWSGRNMNGLMVASGTYLLHLRGAGISQTQKVVVIK
ncbi:MAG: T9SS type A sorting domain-containing protein [Elusimicrobia bacterium]|nr:T9SS type A sorting domain-containing protein [Elusimicrobiota bacterium]